MLLRMVLKTDDAKHKAEVIKSQKSKTLANYLIGDGWD